MMERAELALSALGKRYALFHAEEQILVGFSGGSDSTALLSALYALQKRCYAPFGLTALHVHHGIRGEEADRDADFCRTFCAERGIGYAEYRRDVPAYAEEHRLSLEDAAREVRYACFSEYLEKHPEITCLMTAHHADDQAETVLLRLLHGTAMHGLSGIPEKRMLSAGGREIPVYRPFLSLSKEELFRYCRKTELPFVTDSTNAKDDCSRNLLRNRILPAMQEINPAFPAALRRLSEQAALDEDYFRGETDKILSTLDGFDKLPLDRIRSLHPAILQRVLYALFLRAQKSVRGDNGTVVPPSSAQIAAMRGLVAEGGKPKTVSLPSELCFFVFPAGNICGFSREEKKGNRKKNPQLLPLAAGVPVPWSDGSVCFLDDGTPESRKNLQDLKNIHKLFISTPINYATIKERVFLIGRYDAKTDRYLCGGSEKKVKDALSAHKVPPAQRETIPLFCDADGIVWIPFCGIRDSVNPRYEIYPDPVTLYYFYEDKGVITNAASGH